MSAFVFLGVVVLFSTAYLLGLRRNDRWRVPLLLLGAFVLVPPLFPFAGGLGWLVAKGWGLLLPLDRPVFDLWSLALACSVVSALALVAGHQLGRSGIELPGEEAYRRKEKGSGPA